MTSQIFQTKHHLKSGRAISASLSPWQSSACQWIVALLFMATVIFYPERPAWGDEAGILQNQPVVEHLFHQMEAGSNMVVR